MARTFPNKQLNVRGKQVDVATVQRTSQVIEVTATHGQSSKTLTHTFGPEQGFTEPFTPEYVQSKIDALRNRAAKEAIAKEELRLAIEAAL